ncbi:RecQ family ATP-dependent DNA helicase [Sediminibacillus albus]|uniref:ATP-dependent DNA helicase RecQ n=1 Tax=Sediminibacillus albus TaxID=407036 RepID=A0A1G8VLF4_9BACI|nr:ATP-dependent DNA helicase RecQ [Sediminibacillus albus]SDJ66842.1 ATP-dependent DNA helicase RecQ [Sediminibacillus albus]
MSLIDKALKKYYGFSSFRPGQKEIIEDVLAGKDVLGILPTGSGKSICYQLPARVVDGSVLVISPLISLMIDQEKELQASGFKDVIAFNSFLSFSRKQRAFQHLADYKLIYASPEMLQNERFMQKLSKLEISLFVVDEAHCISQWGHEFRPDYLKLDETIKALNDPAVLALSATATPEVQKDIAKQLNRNDINKHIYPMDRENIAFQVTTLANAEEKINYIAGLLKEHSVPTMIYFSSRNWTEKAVDQLAAKLPKRNIAFYHGGMEQTDRILVQQQFMKDQLDIICCTSAFGMGINKPNIRLVIHFHLPTQVESFIQEVGRAGRDGQSSVSLVLTAPNDDLLPKLLINSELPGKEDVRRTFQYLKSLLDNHQNEIQNGEQLIQHLNINETQWRFMSYHLEKNGIMKDNNLLPYHLSKWQTTYEEILALAANRVKYKMEKLSELLVWAEKDQCRRQALFASFQDTIKEPAFSCCDVCGFSFKDWHPIKSQSLESSLNWKVDFKQLMLQGGDDEKVKPG